ncbi:hypothetical protein KY285_020010 [Solanum tuberosum]|nr:hypothetical protein KY289_020251 [Solanum tuberosum]KAH0692913.1 hypothetical protein KY285_020010 [Solanum tuberosum]
MSNQDQFSGNSESQLIENSAQKKLKIETECEEIDRINWQYFWTCINKIGYDNEEYSRSWLEFAVNKKVEDLRFNIRYIVDPAEHDQPYSLPEVIGIDPSRSSLWGLVFIRRIKLRNFSSLNHANLDLNCDEFDEMDEKIVKDLLVSARCANELILSSWFVKVSDFHFDVGRGRRLLSIAGMQMVDNKFLYFKTFVPPTRQPLKDIFMSNYHPFYEDEDIDLSKDKKYLSIEENIFKVSLHNLKNVKVMPLCSHTYTSDATELHQFLKFLLEHAINLEKLVVVPEHNDCNNSSTNTSNLMKYLLPFPTSAIISLGPVSHNVFYSKFV